MSEQNSLINLDGVHNTLIDINGTTTHFIAKVVVTPSSDDLSKTYKIGIVSQEELDAGDMNIKEHTGEFSNMITKDSGEFQNLFLYLQSSEQMKDIDVSVTTEEIEPRHKDTEIQEQYKPETPDNFPQTYTKVAIGLIILVIGMIMLRRFYNERI